MNIPTEIMLTGAGFTHNFGGLLGHQMFSKISNYEDVRSDSALKSLLLKERDYETAYGKVFEDEAFSEEQRSAMTNAMLHAYGDLHEQVASFVQGNHPDFFEFRYGLPKLMQMIREKGLIFTLNQDLFFEYTFNYHSPGAPHFASPLRSSPGFTLSQFVRLSPDVTMDDVVKGIQSHGGPSYIKLHGSYGWLSSTEEHRMVVGGEKRAQIDAEPLLRAYFQLFEEALLTAKKHVLIIGYSFRDQHINELLLESIRRHGTKLFIINPRHERDFIENMEKSGNSALLEGKECYFPYRLKEICYAERSPQLTEIRNAFVEGR